MSPLLTLNPTWLRNRLAQQGLRQWWLAEQLGADRKTVLRWVNGRCAAFSRPKSWPADKGERQAQRAEAAAQRGDHRRGVALGPLLQVLVAARRGQRQPAEEGLPCTAAAALTPWRRTCHRPSLATAPTLR